jgi:hypothetical protein
MSSVNPLLTANGVAVMAKVVIVVLVMGSFSAQMMIVMMA